jgi:hypothetical protein
MSLTATFDRAALYLSWWLLGVLSPDHWLYLIRSIAVAAKIRNPRQSHQPRFLPITVLLANQRAILPRRQAEARAERPGELAGAAEAAAVGDFLQRVLVLIVGQHKPQGLVAPILVPRLLRILPVARKAIRRPM